MKHFNTLFDIFLFETIFAFIFSGGLFFFEDPYAGKLLYISIVSLVITITLAATGHYFKLFKKERAEDDY